MQNSIKNRRKRKKHRLKINQKSPQKQEASTQNQRKINPKAIPAVASVLAVSVSVVCDQVDQVVPAHQVDDIDEVHELDPVHQVDHKDECSKISLQKRHHKMDQPGFKKQLFPTFFKKTQGHFEGSGFKPFVIRARVPVDFKVVFG